LHGRGILPDSLYMERKRGALAALSIELAETIARQLQIEGDFASSVPGLHLYRRHTPAVTACHVYEPAFAVVAQGAKTIEVGGELIPFGEVSWLLTPLHVPAISRITKASPQRPYLACAVLLDMQVAREMVTEVEATPGDESVKGLAVTTGPMTVELLDAVLRMVRLNENQRDIPVLSKLLQREICYRLVSSAHAGVIRQIITAGSQSQRVARAVDWLRVNFRDPLRVEDLAQHAHMGVSTLHHHFREMTGSSPLQFQKQLRLFEAQRLMLMDGMDSASAAFATGYESATQFSREYRRQFGQPPRKDVVALKGAEVSACAGEQEL
jgi:AraC-like DNA-binding protein